MFFYSEYEQLGIYYTTVVTKCQTLSFCKHGVWLWKIHCPDCSDRRQKNILKRLIRCREAAAESLNLFPIAKHTLFLLPLVQVFLTAELSAASISVLFQITAKSGSRLIWGCSQLVQ